MSQYYLHYYHIFGLNGVLPQREESLRGYLVMGNMVHTFWLQDDGEGVEVRMAEQAYAMSAPGDQFTRDLSIRNWNYQS